MNQPRKPEPKYFLKPSSAISKEEYLNTFFQNFNSTEHKWIGDKSTSYIENMDSFTKMKSMFGTIKVILILRDPVKRALSNYKFSLQNKLETRTPEEVFLKDTKAPEHNGKISVYPFAYVERSKYVNYIDKLDIMNENVLLVKFEDIQDNPQMSLNSICSFLEIDNFTPSFSMEENSSYEFNFSEEIISVLKEEFRESNLLLKENYGIEY